MSDLFDPGDRVKVLVLKVDKEQHRVSLGLKASYFEDDLSSDSEEDSDEETSLQEKIDDCERNKNESDMDEDSIDSEDEEYVSKLAEKMASLNEDSGSSDENDDRIESDSNDTESEDDISADTDKKIAFDHGFDGFITKPITEKVLIDTIHKYLSKIS